MNESEKVIWQMLSATFTLSTIGRAASYTTDDNIYVAIPEGLITIPHPKSSIQWGCTDGEVTGVYTFKPAKG